MSKSIKVDEQVYQDLRALKRPFETYSDIIARLIRAGDLMATIQPLIDEKRTELQERFARGVSEKTAHG